MSNKIALVTGGSRGIGRSTVLKLAKEGNDIIFTYQSRQEEAMKVADEVSKMGRKAKALALDVSKSASFTAFSEQVAAVIKEWGASGFDILVNNAGISHHNEFLKTTEEELDNLYHVHFKGVFFLTQKLASLLNDGAAVVNISTGLTRFSAPGSGAYASVKAAVEVLTKYMALELSPRKIRVNVVAPGAVATDFSGGMVRDNKEMNARVASLTAMGRVGEPDDIAGAIVALASGNAGWVTGQRLEASGGMVL